MGDVDAGRAEELFGVGVHGWGGGNGGFAQGFGDGFEEFGGAVVLLTGFLEGVAAFVFREGGFGKADELVVDGEFEFEFDGVDEGFHARFGDVVVAEFEPDEDHVHADAEEVDGEQLQHGFADAHVVDRAEELDGGEDVDAADDGFLDAEAHQLDALHHVEAADPAVGGGGVGAVDEDKGGRVEAEAVDDDGDEDCSEEDLVADDEIEAGVEDEGLA